MSCTPGAAGEAALHADGALEGGVLGDAHAAVAIQRHRLILIHAVDIPGIEGAGNILVHFQHVGRCADAGCTLGILHIDFSARNQRVSSAVQTGRYNMEVSITTIAKGKCVATSIERVNVCVILCECMAVIN